MLLGGGVGDGDGRNQRRRGSWQGEAAVVWGGAAQTRAKSKALMRKIRKSMLELRKESISTGDDFPREFVQTNAAYLGVATDGGWSGVVRQSGACA